MIERFRIRQHGNLGHWWKVQERFLLIFWLDRGVYMGSAQEALAAMHHMQFPATHTPKENTQ